MKKIIFICGCILLISLMLISSYYIYRELKQNKKQENNFKKLIEIAEQTDQKQQEENIINIQDLYLLNDDIVGWLKIENTSINYPVMQTINSPNYYLYRDFYRQYSSYGTPYIAEQCSMDISDNLVIYGHHMNNKRMFGELEKYKIKNFYENHKILEFTTLEQKQKYEIFAVFKTVAYSKNGFKYYNFINFNTEDEFNIFINKCKELSFYETNRKPKYKDKLITLSTCEYSNKNGRLVIVAYKLES